MIRATIFLCFLVVFALGAPRRLTGEEYEKTTYRQFFNYGESLTQEEREILKELVLNYTYGETWDDFFNVLQSKSSSLHAKTLKFRKIVEEKIELLDEDAKIYVKSVFDVIPAVLKGFSAKDEASAKRKFNNVFNEYKNLSGGAKTSLDEHFPVLKAIAENY